MHVSIHSRLAVLLAVGMAPLPSLCAQATAPAARPASAAPAPASSTAAASAPTPAPANLDQAVATVNGEKITKGDLLNFLSRYQLPPIGPEQIYRDAINTLINTRLVGQYLNRQKIAVPPEKVNEAIAQLERELKTDGRDLRTALLESRQTMDDLRREYSDRIRWIEFLNIKATDAELKSFAAQHKDLINGTEVRARHIFLKVAPDASAADKEKVRQKLLAIKQDILSKKTAFPEAANKLSEDPANSEGAGGDVGYFGLGSGFIEEFATAAFALKPGVISDPVETPYGLHLIEVTDRKEGKPTDFEQQKPLILRLYAADLQKQILTAERKALRSTSSPCLPISSPPSPPPRTPIRREPRGTRRPLKRRVPGKGLAWSSRPKGEASDDRPACPALTSDGQAGRSLNSWLRYATTHPQWCPPPCPPPPWKPPPMWPMPPPANPPPPIAPMPP